jgi:hypothetical protein
MGRQTHPMERHPEPESHDASVLVALGFQLPVDPSPNPAVHRIDDADKVIGLIPPEYPWWLPIVQAHSHLSRFD